MARLVLVHETSQHIAEVCSNASQVARGDRMQVCGVHCGPQFWIPVAQLVQEALAIAWVLVPQAVRAQLGESPVMQHLHEAAMAGEALATILHPCPHGAGTVYHFDCCWWLVVFQCVGKRCPQLVAIVRFGHALPAVLQVAPAWALSAVALNGKCNVV